MVSWSVPAVLTGQGTVETITLFILTKPLQFDANFAVLGADIADTQACFWLVMLHKWKLVQL